MSLLAMPILIINLGGEMMYILEQRLQAQNIPDEKSKKVIKDIIRTMYNSKFVSELFKPQPIYSPTSTRQIFDRIAHSSIMRLSESSMDKLYDLMTMGFKYQLVSCSFPAEILQVTMNHLDSLRCMVAGTEVMDLVDTALCLTTERFASLSAGDFTLLRQSLCQFFQDKRVKVSLFLQGGLQNMDGSLVVTANGALPPGVEAPGTIRYFDANGNAELSTFTLSKNAAAVVAAGPASVSNLGSNLYSKNRPAPKATAAAAGKKASRASDAPRKPQTAAAELNLLSHLMGSGAGGEVEAFKINLFPDSFFPTPEASASSSSGSGVRTLVFDTDVRDKNRDLADLMADMDSNSGPKAPAAPTEEDDLMDLLPS